MTPLVRYHEMYTILDPDLQKTMFLSTRRNFASFVLACRSPVGGGGSFKNIVDEPAIILTKHSSVFITLIKRSAYSMSAVLQYPMSAVKFGSVFMKKKTVYLLLPVITNIVQL